MTASVPCTFVTHNCRPRVFAMLPLFGEDDVVEMGPLSTTATLRHGDIVAFDGPSVTLGGAVKFDRPELVGAFMMRVIGLPGDDLHIKGDRTILNGQTQPRCELGPWQPPEADMLTGFTAWVELLGPALPLHRSRPHCSQWWQAPVVQRPGQASRRLHRWSRQSPRYHRCCLHPGMCSLRPHCR